MSQLALFDTTEVLLADDERGRIAYAPCFVDAVVAGAWFAELRRDVPWRNERRMMYDREIDVPRLTGHFRLDSASETMPRAIVDAGRRLVDRMDVPFNSVGLNLYRDGRDSVAPHNDHLNELQEGFPIALVSVGASRRMTIRAKAPSRRAIHVELASGSLLVMDYRTQLHYVHGIPKATQAVDERISMAFRVRRRAGTRADDTGSGFYR